MSPFTVIRYVPLRHRTLLFLVQLNVVISSLYFYLLFTILLKKTLTYHVFVWVVKKGLTALVVLLTQQIVLFEHSIRNNFITCA